MSTIPCREGDPEDWFLTKSGTQYADEPLQLTEEEALAVLVDCEGRPVSEVEEYLADALKEKLKQVLTRRRKARDACYECPIRATCLEGAITRAEPHGTWGGALEEELRKVYALASVWRQQNPVD